MGRGRRAGLAVASAALVGLAAPWARGDGRGEGERAAAGSADSCALFDRGHAVVYRGPFRQVEDDDGHVLRRGVRTAVCEKTYRILSQAPYRGHFDLVPPRVLEPLEEAPPSCAAGSGKNGSCC